MKNGVEYPFTIPPIYYAYEDGDNLEAIQAELWNVVTQVDFAYRDVWGQTHKLSTKDFADNIISSFNMEIMKTCISNHISEYCKYLDKQDVTYEIISSWLTLNEKDDYASVHNHLPCDMSGCYYFSTDGGDGDIYFNHPLTDEIRYTPIYYCDTFKEVWTHKPAVGKMLLFPAFLSHGVRRNTHDTKRISLSFNLKFK